jgi:hypothetical protein
VKEEERIINTNKHYVDTIGKKKENIQKQKAGWMSIFGK